MIIWPLLEQDDIHGREYMLLHALCKHSIIRKPVQG